MMVAAPWRWDTPFMFLHFGWKAVLGIVVGAPLDFSRFDGMEGDRIVLRAVTDEIMYELKQLSGQEYVDAYASSVKEKRARLAR